MTSNFRLKLRPGETLEATTCEPRNSAFDIKIKGLPQRLRLPRDPSDYLETEAKLDGGRSSLRAG